MVVQKDFKKHAVVLTDRKLHCFEFDYSENGGFIDKSIFGNYEDEDSYQFYDYFSNNLRYNIFHRGELLCMTVSGENGVGLFQENGTQNHLKYNWENKTILIAEDEEANFLYLKTALSRTGVKIIRAKTGREAVDRVKENEDIDLVLMDIKMPEMNGVDATKEIKALNRNIKVIAQTAYAMEEDRIIYFNAGCIDYLEKPIKRDLLLTVISKHI